MKQPHWNSSYHAVACLKQRPEQETWLLEEQEEHRLRIAKRAVGEHAVRLKQEYALLQTLPAPCRFSFLHLEENNGECCLIREYISGLTLAELHRQDGDLSPEETVSMGIRLCRVLALLHEMDPPVIHRDLKPENIIVTETGRIRFIDFETARQYKQGQETDTACLGTRGYAAPEQYGFGQTNPRTDIYATGRILLYLLTGDPDTDPDGLARPDRMLQKILRRCCAVDPAARYADAAALGRALEHCQNRCLPRPAVLFSAAAILLACCVLCGGIGYYLGARSAVPAEPAGTTVSGWNPAGYETSVTEILQLTEENRLEDLSAALEQLVQSLSENAFLKQVQTVDISQMTDEEWNQYYASRTGYEFIADQLARYDGLLVRRLGSYQEQIPAIRSHLLARSEYTWTDDSNNTQSSALHQFRYTQDRNNIDGCLIEILDELNNILFSG